MPLVASFSLFMITAGLTLPRSSGRDKVRINRQLVNIDSVLTDYSLFYYFLIWFMLLAISFVFISIHGIDYVAWPRLNPPTEAIYYDGPGFRSAHNGKGIKGSGASEVTLKRMKWASNGRLRGAFEELELGTLKKRED